MSSDILKLAHGLIGGWLFIRRFAESACKPHALSLSDYMVLVAASDPRAGGASLGDLPALTGLSRASVRSVVDGLEAGGLVARVTADADRRAVMVRTTAAGSKAADDIGHDLQRRLSIVLSSMQRDEVRDLAGKLDHLMSIDAMSRSGILP